MAKKTVKKKEVLGPGDMVEAFLKKNKLELRVTPVWKQTNPGVYSMSFNVIASNITKDDSKPTA